MNKKSVYELLKKYAKKNNIDFLAVYGSYHKNSANENSDLDIIVDKYENFSESELQTIEKDLSKLTGKKIDVITVKHLINSPVCGYVWRSKDYTIIFGEPVVLNRETLIY